MFLTITIESFYYKSIDNLFILLTNFINSKIFIKKIILKKRIFKTKLIFLPKKIKKYTLNKSPHIDKKAREQFETRTYKAIIYIYPIFLLKKESFLIFIYFLKNFFKTNNYTTLVKSKIVIKI